MVPPSSCLHPYTHVFTDWCVKGCYPSDHTPMSTPLLKWRSVSILTQEWGGGVALMMASWSGDMHNYLHAHAPLTYMYTHVLKHLHMTGWLPMAGNGPVPYRPWDPRAPNEWCWPHTAAGSSVCQASRHGWPHYMYMVNAHNRDPLILVIMERKWMT